VVPTPSTSSSTFNHFGLVELLWQYIGWKVGMEMSGRYMKESSLLTTKFSSIPSELRQHVRKKNPSKESILTQITKDNYSKIKNFCLKKGLGTWKGNILMLKNVYQIFFDIYPVCSIRLLFSVFLTQSVFNVFMLTHCFSYNFWTKCDCSKLSTG